MLIVGASKGENVLLTCVINSYPLPRRFFWKFENSEESVEIEQSKFNNNGTKSILSFSTASDHDYGSLSCWAKNEIGVQSTPCIFQLILAGEFLIPYFNASLWKTVFQKNLKCHLNFNRTTICCHKLFLEQ